MKQTKHSKEKNSRKKHVPYKLVPGTRVASLVFTLIATFIASNIAILAANTYYNLDTGEIVVNEVQRVTSAIRATGGLIVGGTATQSPTAGVAFEVTGTENILFSTSGTILQSGTGAVRFNGKLGLGMNATTYEFEVADSGGTPDGIVASFGGRVIGANAVSTNEFVTLGQITGGSTNAFLQGGNTFGELATLGTNDAFALTFETNNVRRMTILSTGNVGIANTSPTELLTLGTAGTTAGTLSLAGSTSGRAIIVTSAAAGTPTLTLPTTTGTVALLSDITASAVTLAGENYLSLTGQQITANAVNLASTNVTGTLTVAKGGTGAATHTSGGVLFGAGTGAFTNSGVMTNGQLLIGDGSGAPTVSTLTAGSGVTISNGAGSITISADTGGLGGTFFAQGGNSFAAPAVLGTNDVQSLSFETSNTSRVTIGAAGGVTLASGNDFTVTSGTSSFGGDVNLTGGNRTLATTAGSLSLSASGANTIRLASASTGNIEFFNANNYITSSGNLVIAGNFTLSGLTITNNGTLTTIASTGGDGLVLDSADGIIRIASGDSLQTTGGYNLTSGNIFREVQPIFGFDVPIRCSTACNNTFVTISRAIENYAFPTAYTGTTRRHNFTIHYADSLATGTTSWRVYNTTDLVEVSTFTVPFSPTNDLDDSAAIYTTGDVAIPTDGDDWVLQVSMPLGGTLQVNQVFLGAYDAIN
jgi:hypothetical protein